MPRTAPAKEAKTRRRGELRLIRPRNRNLRTAQTPGLRREAAIDKNLAGARNLWMGFVVMDRGVACAPHHHGRSESGVYLLRGACRFRFGDKLEKSIDATQGDFVYVPPFAVHQEINLNRRKTAEFIVVRDSPTNIVVPVRL